MTHHSIKGIQDQSYSGKLQFSDNPLLVDLEKEAKRKGLKYVDQMTTDNGAVYKGYLDSDVREGPGIQIWPNGDKYEGEWRQDMANGQGKFWHVDGDLYEGQWKDDQANGKGIYRYANGTVYDGYWKHHLQDGEG